MKNEEAAKLNREIATVRARLFSLEKKRDLSFPWVLYWSRKLRDHVVAKSRTKHGRRFMHKYEALTQRLRLIDDDLRQAREEEKQIRKEVLELEERRSKAEIELEDEMRLVAKAKKA